MQPDRRISRREALKQCSAGTLLVMGLWPGALKAEGKTDSGAFRFLAVNDTHYMTPDCVVWLEHMVRQMNTHEKIELCLHAGDLVDAGRRADLETVRAILKGLPLPTYVVIGNHDYLTQTDRVAYEKVFPRRLNYSFEHRGWQFVCLDSTDGLRSNGTVIPAATYQWLDQHLRELDPKRPMVILTHFPLGANVPSRPKDADTLLERFKPFNLQAVFCGHYHGFTERTFGATTLTTNQCCALKRGNHDNTPEKGYFVCEAKDGKITRTFVELRQKTAG